LFKIVTSASLIESARVSPGLNVCWQGGQHGLWQRHLKPGTGSEAQCGPFAKALGHSQNAVFAQLATRFLSHDRLLQTARAFGFDQTVPFDLEIPMGTLTVPADPLDFARTAAGFQGSHLTPLGAAHMTYVIANKGRAAQIRIVESLGEYHAPSRRTNLSRVLRESTSWELRKMMEVTVHEGTSFDAFSDKRGVSYLGSLRVAGKTGTLKESKSSPTTSWFVGFAPSRSPRIVVSVLLQNGEIWHRRANEIARDVMRSYFSDRGVRGVQSL
jgi:cell division protein FtsI/penicillin-binding protein 2